MNLALIAIMICLICILFCIITCKNKWQIGLKASFIVVFFGLSAFALIYSHSQLEKMSFEREFESAFYDNETLLCNNIEVNRDNFIYFKERTYFFGKENYKNMTISIFDCKKHIKIQKNEIIND